MPQWTASKASGTRQLGSYGWLSIGFFFFQAEDGIRDYKVTGVQTCALPIFSLAAWMRQQPNLCRIPVIAVTAHALVTEQQRSEERRVGKECRSRWSPYH